MTPFYSLLRILFLRGSPERVLYVRRNFIIGLLGALVASGAAQYLYHGDHLVFMILRVFAEVTMFMLWMVVLTGKVARLRLANAMLILVWTSILMDTVLILIAPLMGWLNVEDVTRDFLAFGWGAVLCYGVINVIAWALRLRGFANMATVHLAGYLIAVFALDASFRGLYNVMASS